jgi:prophage maintenance system killer protein
MDIIYPDVEAVIEANKIVLKEIRVLKADRHEVLIGGKQKIQKILNDVENSQTSIYDKAAILLSGLVKAHAFASGNRRTAYAVTKEFLLHNKADVHKMKGNIETIMKGIREDFYTNDEIIEWLKGGEVREPKR